MNKEYLVSRFAVLIESEYRVIDESVPRSR